MTPDGSAGSGVAAPVGKTRLQRLRWPLMSLAAIAVIGGGGYFYFTSGRYQSTDDAYAQAATVSISARVAGRVSEIDVRDNAIVQRGATLFKLDDAPFRIAVERCRGASGRDSAANRVAEVDLSAATGGAARRERYPELRAAAI